MFDQHSTNRNIFWHSMAIKCQKIWKALISSKVKSSCLFRRHQKFSCAYMSFSAETFPHLLVLTGLLLANSLAPPSIFFFFLNFGKHVLVELVLLYPVSQEKIAHGWMGVGYRGKKKQLHGSSPPDTLPKMANFLCLLLLLWSKKTLQMEISFTKGKVKFKSMVLSCKIKLMEFIWSLLHDESLLKPDNSAIVKHINNRTVFIWLSSFCFVLFGLDL